jgi:hypothetical protein
MLQLLSSFSAAQRFVLQHSIVADVYFLKTDKELVNMLQDSICKWGARYKIISDCVKAEMGSCLRYIQLALVTQAWHSDTYHQNRNFAGNGYNTMKANTNHVQNLSGAPANTWLNTLTYVCLLLSHLPGLVMGWVPPTQKLTAQMQDISMLLHYQISFILDTYHNTSY